MSKTWEDRIAGAAKAFGMTVDQFDSILDERMGLTKELGVAALDDEEVFKFGDFREAFKERPIASLRLAFKALRESRGQAEPAGSSDVRTEQLKALGLKVRLDDADSSILLPLYDPSKPSDPVAQALKRRFGDKPVIAFRDDGSIAVTETVRNIADIEQGYPEVDAITVDGKLTRLWPIGVKPNTMVDEDPLFPGRPLRNGYSTVNNRNWSAVPLWNRQLCRIVVERGEIDVNNKEAVLRLIERATFKIDPDAKAPVAPTPHKELTTAYPEADMEYRERQSRNDLPKLRVELSSLSKPNNPFGVPRRY